MHYAKWSTEYQRRTVEIMGRIHGVAGAYMAHEEFWAESDPKKRDYLVPEVGVEPTCSVKSAGF